MGGEWSYVGGLTGMAIMKSFNENTCNRNTDSDVIQVIQVLPQFMEVILEVNWNKNCKLINGITFIITELRYFGITFIITELRYFEISARNLVEKMRYFP